MKFLCPNCKAKYQISDEKIVGRTLKMDCRRCSHPIVIRGDKLSAEPSASRSASGRPRGGSHVGPAPSSRPSSRTALGADFRKNHPARHDSQSEAPAALDQWHVAIQDVPVGPLRREEIAQKIASGAVRPDSLCWREGFDDWRPVKDVPELAPLLRKGAPAAPPPPSRSLSRGSAGPRPVRPPSQRTASQAPRPAESSRPAARGGLEARGSTRGALRSGDARRAPAPRDNAGSRGNVVPIGGRLGAAAAPAVEDFADDLSDGVADDEPTRVGASLDFLHELERREEEDRQAEQARESEAPPEAPAEAPAPSASVAEEDAFDPFASQRAPAPVVDPAPAVAAPVPPSAPPEERRRRGIPVGAWIGIAGAMAFGVTLAVMFGVYLFREPPAPIASNAAPQPVESPAETAEPDLIIPPSSEEAEPEDETEAAPDEAEPSGERAGGGRRPAAREGSRETTERAGSSSGGRQLSAADRARLEQFADDGAGAAPIDVSRNNVLDEGSNRGGGGLSAAQIRSVVTRNQSTVQRCYETATRAAGRAPSLRIDVAVAVSGSGTVTSANARGRGSATLITCIERSIRRWRFPATGGTSQVSLPFVFQGQE